MKGSIKLDRRTIDDLALRLRNVTGSAQNKEEALRSISRTLSAEIGDYLSPEMLTFPDEFSISFIDLLDQIIFETEENNHSDERIKEYIVDDLYLRLCKYLDIMHDRETYKQNLGNGFFTHEDTVIIRHFGMEEYIPDLMTEYHDRPALKKSILRSLLAFTSDDLVTFFYGVAKGESCIEAKILALVGLKLHGAKFKNWKHLQNGNGQFDTVIAYARDFNTEKIWENRLPEDAYTFMFVINMIEQSIRKLECQNFIGWAVQVLKLISRIEIGQSMQSDIYFSIANILIFCKAEMVRDVLKDQELMKSFLGLLDMLPPDIFRRVSLLLSLLGGDFKETAQKLINTGEVKPKEGESNILGYLLWGKEAAFL